MNRHFLLPLMLGSVGLATIGRAQIPVRAPGGTLTGIVQDSAISGRHGPVGRP